MTTRPSIEMRREVDDRAQNLLSRFFVVSRAKVRDPEGLAEELAYRARYLRTLALRQLKAENEDGPLHKLYRAFRDALMHAQSDAQFADSYAQTLTYGLLTARWVSKDVYADSGERFSRHNAVDHLPLSHSFLDDFYRSALMAPAGQSRLTWILDDIANLLDRTAINEVFASEEDNDDPWSSDPVIHFYEPFLDKYDAETRQRRGVYYTPRPVVIYIVQSVHELLQSEFGLVDGLADTSTWGELLKSRRGLNAPSLTDEKGARQSIALEEPVVQILDPATGTATFLVEVIDLIYRTMVEKWSKMGKTGPQCEDAWNEYVPRHLLPRLHGFELMMAPYAVAHLKIGLKLRETGYRFRSQKRACVYLTNTLEPPDDSSQKSHGDWLPALADEAAAVNKFKRSAPITVVIGNPPYSGISSNMTSWIDGLLKGEMPDGSPTDSYYHVDGQPLGERKLWLQDDYVKFIRWSQYCLQRTGIGIHGFITNHGYIDNPTFRGMRWSLMESFDDIWILDLHGNLKKKETTPKGGKDVNVFDIQQGVAIGLFTLRGARDSENCRATVRHADLWGRRDDKYRALIEKSTSGTPWQLVDAAEPFFLFRPYDQSEAGDYHSWPAITEVMPVNVTGIVTARDDFVIDFERLALERRIKDLRDSSLSDEAIREKYFRGKGSKKYPPGDSRGWKLPIARKRIRDDEKWSKRYAPILYRPFDVRVIYYVPWVVDWPRTEGMPHMLAGDNIALITSRMTKGETFRHVQATRDIAEVICMSPKTSNNGFVFPLYLYPGVGKSTSSMFETWPDGKHGRRPNLDKGFVQEVEQTTGLIFQSEETGDLIETFGPEDVLAYIYSVLHCTEYRRRFAAMLKLDFPRIPWPGNARLFTSLARLGHDLLALQLLQSPRLDNPTTKFKGPTDSEVEKVSYTAAPSSGTVWIDKAQSIGFVGVTEEVWEFCIGGYQVCHKWLKDRQSKGGKHPKPGRKLSDDDIRHYQKIVASVRETIGAIAQVDEIIEECGGVSNAFASSNVTMSLGQPSSGT